MRKRKKYHIARTAEKENIVVKRKNKPKRRTKRKNKRQNHFTSQAIKDSGVNSNPFKEEVDNEYIRNLKSKISLLQ